MGIPLAYLSKRSRGPVTGLTARDWVIPSPVRTPDSIALMTLGRNAHGAMIAKNTYFSTNNMKTTLQTKCSNGARFRLEENPKEKLECTVYQSALDGKNEFVIAKFLVKRDAIRFFEAL